MRYLAFAFATLLLAPALASANSCPINVPLVETSQIPLGCPVVVHVRGLYVAGYTPSVVASRNGAEVDITGAVAQSNETLPITFLEYDAACTESFVHRDEPFVRFEIQLAGAQVGDQASPGISVVAAGPCPAPAPPADYSCSDNGGCSLPDTDGDGIPDVDDTDPDAADDGGCSAGGTSSLGLSFALLALVLRRRARPRR